jgi:hypothetical protein
MTKKRLRSLIAFSVLVVILLGGGIFVRNFFLGQVREKIQSIVNYERIHLSLFPPSIVLEDAQTVSLSPFFSAKRVVVELPFASLFKSEKPLTIFIDQPVVRVTAGAAERGRGRGAGISLSLPFTLEKALLRGGEFYYEGARVHFQAGGIQALFERKGEGLSLRMEIDRSSLLLEPNRLPLQGRMRLHLESRGSRLLVNRFVLEGSEAIVKAKGSLANLRNPEGTLQVSFKAGMDSLAGILNIPFRWKGRTEGEGELTRMQNELKYTTSFSSDSLRLNEVPLEKTRGRVEYVPKRGFTVDMNILRRSGLREEVNIRSEAGEISGNLRGFHLDPVLSYFPLPWPVRSAVWGRFSLDARQLIAELEFREESFAVEANRYPFRGPARFTWDRERDIAFSLPQLETSFGRIDVNGKLSIGGPIDVSIKGDFSDVKMAREFTSLVMSKPFNIPEIRGAGSAATHIGGTYSASRVRLDFLLSPAGFANFDFNSCQGFVELAQGTTAGQVRFDDPSYRGELTLLSKLNELDVQIKLAEGAAEKILPRLNIELPLQGAASGNFQVSQRDQALQVEGSFSSSRLKFGFAELKSVSGRLTWGGGILSFPELAFDLYGGKVKNASRLDLVSGLLEINVTAEKLDLSSVNRRLAGELSFDFRGQERLEGEFASGTLRVRNLHYPPLQTTEAEGELKLSFADGIVGLKAKGNFLPGENDFSVEAKIPLSGDDIALDIKGGFSNLDLLLPWKGVMGRVNYLAEVRGLPDSPRLDGAADFQGPLLPFPRFAQALTDYTGLIFVQNNKVSVRSFKAKLGGGNLQGAGEILLGKGGVENLRFTLDGENLLLSPLERTRALADASLRLIKDDGRFALEGNFDVERLSWRREILEKLSFSSSPFPEAGRKPGIFDDLTLNIRLKAEDNAWMENSLGRIRGRFDLTVSGSVKLPIVLGEIEALGGEAYFQDRKFQILRGRVSFFSPTAMEPYVNFRCETYVKDYRVTLTLTGLASQLRPEFASSPPLPPEDVLALLALGEAFKRPYSTETSTQMSTASLLSFTLTEEAQKRAEKLFSLDRFRIDPFLMGSSAEMTARLTVGKKISRDFSIYYSTNLTRQTEEIVRLEWDLGNEFSLIGTRNELGRISFDIKIRKRF